LQRDANPWKRSDPAFRNGSLRFYKNIPSDNHHEIIIDIPIKCGPVSHPPMTRATQEPCGLQAEIHRPFWKCRQTIFPPLSPGTAHFNSLEKRASARARIFNRSWHLCCTSLRYPLQRTLDIWGNVPDAVIIGTELNVFLNNTGDVMAENKDNGGRGFAGMDDAKQREIASQGGRAAHESGNAHEFTSEEAREAGRKGGEASQGGGNRGGGQDGGQQDSGRGNQGSQQMSESGRRGGEASQGGGNQGGGQEGGNRGGGNQGGNQGGGR
jgi:hypothetical protein